ncbi:uncharacterized protein BDFB_000738 [Asbolus verrucosus]|uniref:DNA mismatch repair protein S5 domain-containing protein n=1 Tax=Asbolus verrucosus TaxID=1661398 RepID=A0A482VGN3_ASBVE|nr:uncharacterized protein BDFB_000738 [Asbolus verrucosus]
MVIEALDNKVIDQIRSSSTIDSVTQCLTELVEPNCVVIIVLNSLDAKSMAIAVRVNLTTFRIQIVDNGKGISRQNLEFVGQRYMTNKCHTLSDLKKHISTYGFKGEALASISKISQRVSVTSREQNCEETYCKTIEGNNSKIELVQTRPSFGTTVTIDGFLNNLPVRQQCIKSTELENVKKSLESLTIIHPRVSFSLRNELTGKIILDSKKCLDIATSFKNIHPDIDDSKFVLFKVSRNKISVGGLIHKEFHENKRLQYIYVNKRPITCPKIQNFLNTSFRKIKASDPKKAQPIFVIHIKCPYSDIDLSLEPSKTVVFFKKVDIVQRCLEKMINTFLGKENLQTSPKKAPQSEIKSEFGISQIGGAVRGLGMKRKSDDLEAVVSSKSPKIIEEETPFFEEEPKVATKQVKTALPIKIKKSEKKDCEEVDFDDAKENSMFTNFPDNERKGKDIIMDMFIKSVQVFPDESKSPESCGKTFTNCAALDVFKVSPPKPLDKAFMDNQTMVKENMISVGVQVGLSNVNPLNDISDVTFNPRKSLKNYVSDYNFDFSKVEALPAFNLNRTFAQDFINLDQTKKLFDFRDNCSREFNIFGVPYYKKKNYDRVGNANILEMGELGAIPKMSIEKCLLKNKTTLPNLGSENITKSPYFLKKGKTRRDAHPLKHSPKKAESCCLEDNYETTHKLSSCQNRNIEFVSRDSLSETVTDFEKLSSERRPWNHVEMTCSKRNKTRNKNLNESTVSSYFVPQKLSVNHHESEVLDHSKDLFLSINPSGKSNKCEKTESGIVITVDEEDMQKIMERDLQYEKQLVDDVIPSTLTQIQSDWLKEVNIFGTTVYTNKKTGVKSFHSPKKDLSFEMAERFEFVPKGLSPILKDYGKVDSMSPESKENLQNAVIQSYEDELLLVKWQNYIDNKDPKTFFEEIYMEKSKLIENAVPNVSRSALAKREIFENMSFTKEVFKNLDVIGQVDHKFIAVLERTKNLILLFDQHAVHERVRLEQLLEGAIKFGDSLSKTECFVHLKDLAKCNLPFQCAHGRPTLTPLISLNKSHDTVGAKPCLNVLKRL